MSKEKQTEEKSGRVLTKYDRKMERRKEEEEKERRSWLRFKIGSLVAAAAILVAVVVSVGTSVYGRYRALHQTYVRIGGHDLTKVEYDFYYNGAVNNYLQMYGSYASMMGLDPTVDLEQQAYPGNDEMTWKDYFDRIAVDQITQVKALVEDAAAKGFTYDDSEDLESFRSNLEAAAEASSVSVAEYYTSIYGEYATASRMEPMVKENLLSNAYYDHLIEQNSPSEEEIQAYYEENKDSYDLVDYRSFYFEAGLEEGASGQDVLAAMEELEAQADEMEARGKDGEDFEALCKEYAAEDAKEDYGDGTDGSLTEGARNHTVPTVTADWLFEGTRKEGDLTVIPDENANRCYVLEFLGRQKDEENADSSISDILSGEAVSGYVAGLTADYEVTDVAGDLKYLLMGGADNVGTSEEEDAEGTGEEETDTLSEDGE